MLIAGPDNRAHRPMAAVAGFSRLALVLVTLGVLLAQGTALGHLLVVQHGLCEHGELVDAAAHSDAPYDGSPRTDKSWAPDSSGESEHDHCNGGSLPHRFERVEAPVAGATILCRLPQLGGARGEQRALAPLVVAPKASPPLETRPV
jgi:hypothetical protein